MRQRRRPAPPDRRRRGRPEAIWQGQVAEWAAWAGFTRRYHTLDSRGSPEGFPDLILGLLAPLRLVVVECKIHPAGTLKGEPTGPQRLWLDFFRAYGAETFVWRPADAAEVVRVLWRHAPGRAPELYRLPAARR
jgi:hypothetical protein